MNKFKRFLALFLVLGIMLGIAPLSAFAAEDVRVDTAASETAPTGESTAPNEETPVPTEGPDTPAEENTVPTEETEVPTEETTGSVEETVVPAEGTTTPTEETEVSVEEPVVFSEQVGRLNIGNKPDDGTTTGQPFKAGTGESSKFRIPGIVTLNSGRIVASCDARWNTTVDGGGLDTIVSYSDDGNTWHYTFANYLGDNGNKHDGSSTAFIDPAIATDGKLVYMIADIFPAGYALNGANNQPKEGSTGFDANGNLLLRIKDNNRYSFYLKDGQIFNENGTPVEDYTVDAYFNITGSGVNTNLFYADSPYQPFPTNYLYLTTSSDGQNWSEPQLLNLKTADEQTFLVGPGNGTYDAVNNHLIFTAYNHTNGYERTSLIWRDADGNWYRTAPATDRVKSSEATAVVLKDGTVRCFYRGNETELAYTDYAWSVELNNYAPVKAQQTVSGAAKTQNNQLSAIKYSKTINGEEVILVSTATGTGTNRSNGKIYALTVDPNTNEMTLLNAYQVNKSGYSYSCLTELINGDIGLLYEPAGGEITYKHIPIADITQDETFDPDKPVGPDPTVPEPPVESEQTIENSQTGITVTAPGLTELSVAAAASSTPAEGYTASVTYEITLNGGAYTGNATVKIPVDDVFAGCTEFTGMVDTDSFEVPAPVDGFFTVEVPHFSAVTISGRAVNAPSVDANVTLTVGQSDTREHNGLHKELTAADITNNNTDIVDVTITSRPNTTGSTTEHSLGGLVASITSGEQYVIASGTNMLVSSGTNAVGNAGKTDKVDVSALWTITKSDTGYVISQDIGGTIYYLSHNQKSAGGGFKGSSYSYTPALSQTPSVWMFDEGNRTFYQNLESSRTFWGAVTKENFYLTAGSNWTLNKTAQAVDLYNVTHQQLGGSTTYDHTITFTGKSIGTTTVTVGDILYTVTVKDKLTFENSPFLANSGAGKQYKNAAGQMVTGNVTKLTTSRRLSYQLKLDSTVVNGQKVEWTVDDPKIATVTKDGTVTGVSSGETRVNATVGGVTYSIPVVIKDFATKDPMNSDKTKIYDFYTAEITNTTVWYVWNCGRNDPDPEFHELQEGEAIYVAFDDTADSACNFFAKPDDHYALTQMAAPGSQGHYFKIRDDKNKVDMSQDGFVKNPQAAGKHEAQMWDEKTVIANVQNAIDLGCDGGMGFTRPGNGKLNQNPDNCQFVLSFHSDPLIDVKKTVRGVLDANKQWHEYTDGMTANEGDTVYYQIVVTKYASKFNVNYTNVTIHDVMEQGKEVTLLKDNGPYVDGTPIANPYDLSQEIQADGLAEGMHTYFAKHVITAADLDTTLVNNVTLSYAYKSGYSSGNLSGSATASATITATSFRPQDIVIDFGLPVTVHYEEWGNNVQLQSQGSATYGSVTVSKATDGWDVTYTPHTILKGLDTVTLTAMDPATKATAEYKFNVYPATTVYYEEDFATGNFVGGSVGTAQQETQLAGQSGNVFGYDQVYARENGKSNASEATSSDFTGQTTFTFKGTGFTIYANCDQNTDVASILVKDANSGNLVKFYQVDTIVKGGTTDATKPQDDYPQQNTLPIVSVCDLSYGEYTVTVMHTPRNANQIPGQLKLDGYRVYNTMNDLQSTAYPASEHNPQYAEVRDQLLSALKIDTNVTDSIYGQAGNILDQVYAQANTVAGAIVLGSSDTYTSEELKDILDNGPKNELFLYPNQVLTFNLGTNKAQIGLKAPSGPVTYTLNGVPNTITTSTDMFYHENTTGAVTIQNTSDSILSVTLLKYFGNGSAAFSEVTPDQMVYALRSIGYVEPTTFADAFLNVSLVDYSGTQIADSTLTVNGVEGETHGFTPDDILTTVNQILPAGYGIVDESAITETAVMYGDNSTVSIQIGKTATLNVNYVKKNFRRPAHLFDFGSLFTETTISTATFTAVQTSDNASYTVSADQIRRAAPDGFRVSWGVQRQSVFFGTENTVNVLIR